MASKLRLFTKRFFIYANWLTALLFLLSCLIPLLHPQQWWWVSVLGLAFPFLLLLLVIFLFGWLLILKFRLALISLVALLLAYKSIGVFVAFHPPTIFKEAKTGNTLRIVSWNVARFIEQARNSNKGSATRLKMLELIRKQNADVLCLQEFFTSENPGYYDNIKTIQEKLNYPYYYFSFDKDGDKNYYSTIIFSRYKIVDSGIIRYSRPALPDVLLQADILFNKDTIRVFATHLQSQRFNKYDYDRIEKIRKTEDSMLLHSIPILSKLKWGIAQRSLQADLVAEVMKNSPHPTIFAADMNDVPNSYTYFTIKGNMQDAFLEKGAGLGHTFTGLLPTLRIDYILADKNFKVEQFKTEKKEYSDHYMLVADLKPL
jgi:endonuclease/exonuclease/phosphatase family metal-dependent hydrolase